jgi:hypothetical protein
VLATSGGFSPRSEKRSSVPVFAFAVSGWRFALVLGRSLLGFSSLRFDLFSPGFLLYGGCMGIGLFITAIMVLVGSGHFHIRPIIGHKSFQVQGRAVPRPGDQAPWRQPISPEMGSSPVSPRATPLRIVQRCPDLPLPGLAGRWGEGLFFRMGRSRPIRSVLGRIQAELPVQVQC